jgi:predicted metal-dependent hydrolase
VKTYLWRKPGLFSKGWRTYISWYRPGFHPWDHDNRALIERWKQDFAVPTVASA